MPPGAGSGRVPFPPSHLLCHRFHLRRQGLPSGQLPVEAFGLQNRGIPAFVRDRGLSCGSLPRAQDRKGLWASLPPVCLPPRVLLRGSLRGPRGLRTSPPSLCPLQGLSCPKDHAEVPSATRATSRTPPETQEGRRDHDRPSLHRRGRAPGAQRFPKVLVPLGESPRARGRGRAAAPALRYFGELPRGRKWGTRGRRQARALAPPLPRPGPRPRAPSTQEPPSCRVGSPGTAR